MSDCVIDVLREDIGDESSAYLHYANAPSSAHAIELPAGRSPVDILYIEPMRDDSGRTIERLSSSGASKIMRALSMSRAFRQVSKHQEVICSDESIVLLSFNGVEPLVGCAIDLSRSIGFGVRMALHRHDNLRLTRNDMFSWTLAGDGISEATAIAGFGKPGQILLSESSVMVLPDAYKTFTRMFGRFDLTKRAIVVSVLYSSQHKFGFIDLNHVPANAKPTHFAVNQQEVRHPADRAVTLITILALFGLIGTGCWLCYNNSPILGWRFRDVGSAAAVTPTVRPNSTGNGPAQIETEQAEKPASALEPPVSPPDSSGDGPGDMKSPVLEPEKPQQTAALKALVINRVRSRPDGENNAPWSPWQPSRIDWSGKLTDADATEVYEIEVTVSYGNELSLKAFDRADEEMTTTKTSAPDVGGVQVWTVRGYGSYIKLRFTPRVDISPGLSETAQAPEDAFVRAYHCPKLAKVPSDAKIAP
jgi:hypothetical protein